MAITRLKRKARKNRLRSKARFKKMKIEGFSPVIKNVDVSSAKESFISKPVSKKSSGKSDPAKTEKIQSSVEVKETLQKDSAKVSKKEVKAKVEVTKEAPKQVKPKATTETKTNATKGEAKKSTTKVKTQASKKKKAAPKAKKSE